MEVCQSTSHKKEVLQILCDPSSRLTIRCKKSSSELFPLQVIKKEAVVVQEQVDIQKTSQHRKHMFEALNSLWNGSMLKATFPSKLFGKFKIKTCECDKTMHNYSGLSNLNKGQHWELQNFSVYEEHRSRNL